MFLETFWVENKLVTVFLIKESMLFDSVFNVNASESNSFILIRYRLYEPHVILSAIL